MAISRRSAKHASNIDETTRIILVDELVKNADRHCENVLIGVKKGNNIIHAIDYSHAIGDPDWNIDTLVVGDCDSPYVWRENQDLYDILISAGGTVSHDTLRRETERIRSCIDESFIDTILRMIPEEWKKRIGQNRVDLAKQYVLSRVNGLERICEMIMKERGM